MKLSVFLGVAVLLATLTLPLGAFGQQTAQSNVLRAPAPEKLLILSNGIPEELRGKYVLIARTTLNLAKFDEDLKTPEAFCETQSNQVVLASGEVLQANRITRCVEKGMEGVAVSLTGSNGDFTWSFREKPPYINVLQMDMGNHSSRRTINLLPDSRRVIDQSAASQQPFSKSVHSPSLDTNLTVIVNKSFRQEPLSENQPPLGIRFKLLKVDSPQTPLPPFAQPHD